MTALPGSLRSRPVGSEGQGTSPRRVVSLVPSLTELVCALGAAQWLVGVTRYCTEPADVVGALPSLGGPKDPACDRIVALAPDVVLVSSEENRRGSFADVFANGSQPTHSSETQDV